MTIIAGNERSTWLFLFVLLVAPFAVAAVGFGEVDDFPHAEVLLNESPREDGGGVEYSNSNHMKHDVSVMALDPALDGGEGTFEVGAGSDGAPSSGLPSGPPPPGEDPEIIRLEKKRSDVEGPLKLKVDDKNGLIEEGPYKGSDREAEKSVPKICSDGVPCQRVDSRVRPSTVDDGNDDEISKKAKKGKPKRKSRKWRRRRRRSIRPGPDGGGPDDVTGGDPGCEHQASIMAFGANYTLCLFLKDFRHEPILEKSWPNLNVTIFGINNSSEDLAISTLTLKYATGFVLGEDFTSVTGFLMDDHFYGTVYMRDTVHYLEPHNRKSRDMHIFGDGLKTLLHKHDVKGSKEMKDSLPGNGDKESSGNTPQRRICDLTIVSDHLFFSDVGERSVEKTVLQMLWHIKEANALFQSKDFDNDGRSECIGFTVSEITIFKTADSAVNLLTGEYSVPEDFLKKFSRYNFDGFCLGVLFTNRAFSELVLGLSWRGNPKPDGVGGICQSRVRIKSDKNAYSFNALFISLKSSQEDRIPLRMGVLNLVHEMMHSFGAKHDPDASQNPACTPKDKWVNGRFLMSKYSNDGHKLNHEILSPCTQALVRKNLASQTRVACLIKVGGGFCGDGVVQAGEDCDCGTIFQCIAARSCCVPPEGSGDKKSCSVQRDLTACVRGS